MPTPPTIFVIFGITGDLAKRKLIPAFIALAAGGKLPQRFHIIGITRQKGVKLEQLFGAIPNFESIKNCMSLHPIDVQEAESYKKLETDIRSLEEGWNVDRAQRLVYLSVPPQTVSTIIENIGEMDIATRLVLEKPFGTDQQSAIALSTHIAQYFDESEVYCIDHYLGKPMVDTINTVHRDLVEMWNSKYISRIDVIAMESIGIEGRVAMYEQTGALRDVIQNHLLEVAAVVTADIDELDIQRGRALALSAMSTPIQILRGQYQGYKEEVANDGTHTETFVSVELHCATWPGTQIVLSTGKHMYQKMTEVRMHVTQPVTAKLPEGVTFADGVLIFDITRGEDAYARILDAAIKGDSSRFVSKKEILESWRIVDPAREIWKESVQDLVTYAPDSKPSDICVEGWCTI